MKIREVVTENKNIENTLAFIQAVKDQTTPHEYPKASPIRYGEHREWNNAVIFSLTPVYGNNEKMERVPMGAYLSDVRSKKQGKGYGTAFLKWLSELSDEYGVSVSGYADPSKDSNLQWDKLRKWYSKNGFDFLDRGGAMQRMPKDA